MKFALAENYGIDNCYNKRLIVISTHKTFDLAFKAMKKNGYILEVQNYIAKNDYINDRGETWAN